MGLRLGWKRNGLDSGAYVLLHIGRSSGQAMDGLGCIERARFLAHIE